MAADQAGQPAVGEQALHEQDHGHAQAAGPGPDQHRGQDAAEHVTAGRGGSRDWLKSLNRSTLRVSQPSLDVIC